MILKENPDPAVIATAIEAVKKGGAVLRENFGKVQAITYKGKLDLVTETDRCSEAVIVDFLLKHYPQFGILAEEQEEIPAESEYRWILDPLDGTTNYAHGYPFFAVSLALEFAGTIVWGAVYDPIRQELFTATAGRGANKNGSAIKVSSETCLVRSLLCTGFPYDVHESAENNINHFERFIKVAQAIRRDGSAALDLCYVGMGRFEGVWDMKLKPWDVAAGALIVLEAGGKVTGFDGAGFDINTHNILAANTCLHGEMLKVLGSSI